MAILQSGAELLPVEQNNRIKQHDTERQQHVEYQHKIFEKPFAYRDKTMSVANRKHICRIKSELKKKVIIHL